MKILGIHLLKGKFYYAILEGTKVSPTLIHKERLVTVDTNNTPNLLNWYETEFHRIITTYNPDKISYRLTLNPSKVQILSSIFPLGIINLLSYKSNIPITGYTPQSFVASKLNLPKGTDLMNHCDNIFGQNPPYWDVNMKNAILASWFEL